jgi:nucleoside-triphosphatase THEP1
MRIALCGNPEDVKTLVQRTEDYCSENNIPVKEVKTDLRNEGFLVVDYASETFRWFKEDNVLFNGSVFDGLMLFDTTGYTELQEQIILSALQNLDFVVFLSDKMPDYITKQVKSYQELYPQKIEIFDNVDDVIIRF